MSQNSFMPKKKTSTLSDVGPSDISGLDTLVSALTSAQYIGKDF